MALNEMWQLKQLKQLLVSDLHANVHRRFIQNIP